MKQIGMKNEWNQHGLMVFVGLLWGVVSGCSPVVGGKCKDGLVLCGNRCMSACTNAMDDGGTDARTDASLDGALDATDTMDASDAVDANDTGDVNADGMDVSLDSGDGSMGDAMDASDSTDVVSEPDVSPPVCGIGQVLCGTLCLDVSSDPNNCGGCNVMCAMGEVCAAGDCVAVCAPAPLQTCGGSCVDTDRDATNCGFCDNVCATGICINGECSDPVAGHVVVVGHNFESSRAAQDRIAANAVFIPRVNPVQVVVYEGTSVASSITHVDGAISRYATGSGRTWRRTPVTAANLTFELRKADVLVVYPQRGSTNAELLGHGTTWSSALTTFVQNGGVILLFDTPSVNNIGTYQILGPSMLFAGSGVTDISNSVINLDALGDVIAIGVPLSYLGSNNTVKFNTGDGVVVMSGGVPSGPVVIHRTIRR